MNISVLKKRNNYGSRFIELDILRGLAIISMIFLHILWDLDYFGLVPINNHIYQFQKIVPTVFFVLLGICLVVSKDKKINQLSFDEKRYNKHLFLRGLKIFGLGLIFTLITMIFIPDRPIIFGVLHCISFSIILSIPLLKFRYYNLVLAIPIILFGLILNQYPVEDPSVLQLAVGFHQSDMAQYTIDYFPLLPWFGACLFGIATGSWLYKNGERRFKMPDVSQYKTVSVFSWLGEHSLLIYLFHQPVIAGVLGIYLIL